jgi:hypothetical protein
MNKTEVVMGVTVSLSSVFSMLFNLLIIPIPVIGLVVIGHAARRNMLERGLGVIITLWGVSVWYLYSLFSYDAAITLLLLTPSIFLGIALMLNGMGENAPS